MSERREENGDGTMRMQEEEIEIQMKEREMKKQPTENVVIVCFPWSIANTIAETAAMYSALLVLTTR